MGATEILAMLCGAALGWLIPGLQSSFDQVFNPPAITAITLAAMFTTLAFGAHLPRVAAQRFKARLGAAGHSEERHSEGSAGAPDMALLWLILAGTAAASGLAALAQPWLIDQSAGLYHWSQDRFLWAPPARAVLHMVIVLLPTAFVFLPFGALMMCVQHTHTVADRRDRVIAPFVLISAAAALTIYAVTGRFQLPESPTIMIGASPLFVIAMIAAQRSTSTFADTHAPSCREIGAAHARRRSITLAEGALGVAAGGWTLVIANTGGLSAPIAVVVVLAFTGAGLLWMPRVVGPSPATAGGVHLVSLGGALWLGWDTEHGAITVTLLAAAVAASASGAVLGCALREMLQTSDTPAAGSTRATALVLNCLAAIACACWFVRAAGIEPQFLITACALTAILPVAAQRLKTTLLPHSNTRVAPSVR